MAKTVAKGNKDVARTKKKTDSGNLGDKFKQSDFVKPLEKTSELFFLECPKCNGVHFRHAGYVWPMIPYVDPKEGPKLIASGVQVMVCTCCKTSVIYYENKIHDITKHIDLKAWEKTEPELSKATGPGGEC